MTASGTTSPTVVDLTLASGRMRAELSGPEDGPLVICVPGLSANLRSYDRIGPALAAAGHRVAAVDLRGRGHSETTAPGTFGWPAHARDVLEVATQLGHRRFDLIGHSMGAFVAMDTAAQDAERLRRVVLIDACGVPEPESLPPIMGSVERLGPVFASEEEYLARARSAGSILPWTDLWDDYFRYELDAVDGGVRARTSREAVTEDAVHGSTRQPAELWAVLTMPTLLLRAGLPVVPGAGFIVSAADARRFAEEVPQGSVVEVDAPHYTIVEHPDSVRSVLDFLEPAP